SLVQASMEEIASFFDLDDYEAFATYKSVLGNNILDRQTLYTIRDDKSTLHQCKVIWTATSFPTLMANRDACMIEFHDIVEIVDQITGEPRRGWVRSLHSIEMSCCPSLKTSHGLVRGQLFRSGHVFLETQTSGVMEHFYLIVPQVSGHIPWKILKSMYHRQVSRVLNFEEHFASRRFLKTLETKQLIPITSFQIKEIAKFCAVCTRTFSFFVSKKHCRKCGHVICSACLTDWRFPIKEHIVKLRICRKCFTGALTNAMDDNIVQTTLTLESTGRQLSDSSNNTCEHEVPILDQGMDAIMVPNMTTQKHFEILKLGWRSPVEPLNASFLSELSEDARPTQTRVSLFSIANTNLDNPSSSNSFIMPRHSKDTGGLTLLSKEEEAVTGCRVSHALTASLLCWSQLNSTMALPLPEGYFECPPLTTKQYDAILNLGQAACNDTVQNALNLQKNRVATIVSNKNTNRVAKIYKGNDSIDYTLPAVCAHTIIQASLVEIADFFFMDSSLKLAAYKVVAGQGIVDRQNLYTLERPRAPSKGRPMHKAMHYTGVSWMAISCPTGVMKRDFCFIEFHDRVEVLDPATKRLRRGWVRALHSIDLPACPSLRTSHSLVRGSLIRLLNLEEFLSMQRFSARLDTMDFVDVHHFQDKNNVRDCTICHRKFGWFVSKKHCRQCGCVTCSTCGRNWKLPINGRPVKLRICQNCFCPREPQKNLDDGYEPKLIFTSEAFESHRSIHDAIMDSLRRFDESTLLSQEESSNGDESTYCESPQNSYTAPRISGMSAIDSVVVRSSSFGSYLYSDTSLDSVMAVDETQMAVLDHPELGLIGLSPSTQNEPEDVLSRNLRPPPPFVPENPNIFIGLSVFRDGVRCGYTLYTGFQRAKYPERIRFGVVDQVAPVDPKCIDEYCKLAKIMWPAHECRYKDQITIDERQAIDSRGPTLARHYQQKLVDDTDDFCLQLDGHSVFTKEWDAHLIREWERTGNEMAVLTTYLHDLHDYVMADGTNNPPNQLPHLCTTMRGGSGCVRNIGASMLIDPQRPQMTALYGAGLSFSKCHAERRVPIDPHTLWMFDGEEFLRSSHLWTYGYDLYSPSCAVIYHNYSRVPSRFESIAVNLITKEVEKQMGYSRYQLVLGLPVDGPVNDSELNIYGYGSVRSLEDYLRFAGIDLVMNSDEMTCKQLHWQPYTNPEEVETLVGHGWKMNPENKVPSQTFDTIIAIENMLSVPTIEQVEPLQTPVIRNGIEITNAHPFKVNHRIDSARKSIVPYQLHVLISLVAFLGGIIAYAIHTNQKHKRRQRKFLTKQRQKYKFTIVMKCLGVIAAAALSIVAAKRPQSIAFSWPEGEGKKHYDPDMEPWTQNIPLNLANSELRPPPSRVPDVYDIFVGLSTFRDGVRCGYTLYTGFKRAVNPDRLYFGVVDQVNPGDARCMDEYCKLAKAEWPTEECKYQTHIKIDEHLADDSRGPTYARHFQQKLVGNQEFCLQLDAHSIFTIGWDVGLVKDWKSTGNEMAILSTYLHHCHEGYVKPDGTNNPPDQLPHLCTTMRGGNGCVRTIGASMIQRPEYPQMQALWGAGLSFGKCHAEKRVLIDSHTLWMFDGEEFLRAAHLWTYGYDMYSPSTDGTVIYHNYTSVPARFESVKVDQNLKAEQEKMGINRFKLMVGQPFKGPVDTEEWAKYDFGKVRSFKSFLNFSGITFEEGKSDEHSCKQLHWVPYTAPEEIESLLPGWTMRPKVAPTLAPTAVQVMKVDVLDNGGIPAQENKTPAPTRREKAPNHGIEATISLEQTPTMTGPILFMLLGIVIFAVFMYTNDGMWISTKRYFRLQHKARN
ncbi:GlcNac transferase, partial [Thraustotheca clavata]